MATVTIDQIHQAALVAEFSPGRAAARTEDTHAGPGGDPRARNPSGEDSRGLWQTATVSDVLRTDPRLVDSAPDGLTDASEHCGAPVGPEP